MQKSAKRPTDPFSRNKTQIWHDSTKNSAKKKTNKPRQFYLSRGQELPLHMDHHHHVTHRSCEYSPLSSALWPCSSEAGCPPALLHRSCFRHSRLLRAASAGQIFTQSCHSPVQQISHVGVASIIDQPHSEVTNYISIAAIPTGPVSGSPDVIRTCSRLMADAT